MLHLSYVNILRKAIMFMPTVASVLGFFIFTLLQFNKPHGLTFFGISNMKAFIYHRLKCTVTDH